MRNSKPISSLRLNGSTKQHECNAPILDCIAFPQSYFTPSPVRYNLITHLHVLKCIRYQTRNSPTALSQAENRALPHVSLHQTQAIDPRISEPNSRIFSSWDLEAT